MAVFEGTVTGGHHDIIQAIVDSVTSSDMGTEEWEILADEVSTVNDERHVYCLLPGNSSGDEIYLNFRSIFDTSGSGYYNIGMNYATGYDSAQDYANQPGAHREHFIYLNNATMDYWFMANGQRLMGAVKISTVYEPFYIGWYLQNGFPTEFSYPAFAGACGTSATITHTNVSSSHKAFYAGGGTTLRHIDSTQITSVNMHPYENNSWFEQNAIAQAPGGVDIPFPIQIQSDNSDGNNYGVLDGAYYVSGLGGITSEDRLWFGSIQYIAFQNTFNTDNDDYILMRME